MDVTRASQTPRAESADSIILESLEHGDALAPVWGREANEVALPAVDGGRDAWTFILAGMCVELTIWGYSFVFGIVQVYLSTHAPFQSSSRTAIAAVGTVALSLQYILPVFFMIVFRRYPDWAKAMLWTAVATCSGSMLLSSWANQVYQLVILQGFLGGLSGAVLYTPVLLWLNEWWIEKRGKATGILFAGTGIGGVVLPFVIQTLLDKVGFANAMRIWAAFSGTLLSVSVYFMKPRIPLRGPRRGASRGPLVPVDLAFLRSPTVLLMCMTTLASSLGYFPVSLYIPSYTTELASTLTASIVLAVFNGAFLVGLVLTGWISDKVASSVTLSGTAVACSLTAYLCWGFADSIGKVYLFALLFGLFSGTPSIWSRMSRDVAGQNSQQSGLLFGCFNASRGVGGILGPLISSALFDRSGKDFINTGWGSFGFRNVILFVGSCMLASAAGGAALGGMRKKVITQH